MFVRGNKNRSGSVSVQIIQKIGRRNKVIKTVGCATTQREEELLFMLAHSEIERMRQMESLFVDHDDAVVENFVDSIGNDNLQVVGSELILGHLYRSIGYPEDAQGHDFFKHLVLCRLVYPGSKLKTVEYFKRHLNIDVSVYSVYRYLDQLHSVEKQTIEQITFEHTRKVLGGSIGVVFYDMTTLYFEASQEDDYKIIGYSKDGKPHKPQIIIGMLVGINGYPIGYEVFQGNTAETKTLIPVLEGFQRRFNLQRPVVVADAALLSQNNIDALSGAGYQYVLGARLKSESRQIKARILSLDIQEDKPVQMQHPNGRLIITYSQKRARKDRQNRDNGLRRLEKRVQSGKLSKQHVNNRGYNKYLKLVGEMDVCIDYEKYEADGAWDGLKGYLTNAKMDKQQVVSHYQHLWHIEKAFRISKTDLRIRPVYHRLKHRIEAHLCVCFAAYTLYKELERMLAKHNANISVEKALEQINQIQQIKYTLPKSGKQKTKLLKLNQQQQLLMKIIQ